jgi:hypothetical protein
MYILRIEHPVQNYDGWKKAFGSDPIGRKKSGVRHYRIMRSVDDPNYIMIDLEFDSASAAKAAHAALLKLWSNVDVMRNPQARSVELIEEGDY